MFTLVSNDSYRAAAAANCPRRHNDTPYSPRRRSGQAGAPRRTVPVFLICSLAVALLLSACTVGPQYQRPNADTRTGYKETGLANPTLPSAWKTAQPSDDALRGKWWEMFNDPALNGLEEQANASNQNIVAAAANFTAARALVREARSQYFPSVGTAPSMVNERPSPAQFGGLPSATSGTSVSVKSFSDYSLPLDASWEPDLWGRVRNTVRANAYAAQSSAADLANVRLSVQAELAVDYYELRSQDALIALFDATVASYQDNLDINRNLYRNGLATDESVAQAEAQFDAAQAQDANLSILRAQYEHAIAVLIGKPPADFSLPKVSTPPSAPLVPVGIPSELLERRPDVAGYERSVAQANAQIGVAKSAYYPNLLLQASGGFGNSAVDAWFTWPSRFWAVGPELAETIFDAGLRRATVAQYRAAYDASVANYRQTVLTAFQQVEDNLAALRLLVGEIQQQDAAVDAAARTLQEANVRYRAGLDPYLNVITAQTTLLADQQAAVNFRLQQMLASVQLIKALGGGWNTTQLPTPHQAAQKQFSLAQPNP